MDAAIGRLHDTGAVRPLASRVRNQARVASSLVDELDDLGVRTSARARQD